MVFENTDHFLSVGVSVCQFTWQFEMLREKNTDGIPALQFLYLKMPTFRTAVQHFFFFFETKLLLLLFSWSESTSLFVLHWPRVTSWACFIGMIYACIDLHYQMDCHWRMMAWTTCVRWTVKARSGTVKLNNAKCIKPMKWEAFYKCFSSLIQFNAPRHCTQMFLHYCRLWFLKFVNQIYTYSGYVTI